MNFDRLLAASPRDGDNFDVTVGPEWMQGRTTYGGWAAALAYNVARTFGEGQGEALPPLRSAMINFVGPVFSRFEARPRMLRRGRNAIWIAVDLVKDGSVELAATFLFMRPLESHISVTNLPPPVVTAQPGELAPMTYGRETPEFVRRFEFFPAWRSPPEAPEECQWARLRDRSDLDGPSEMLMIGDISPLGVMRRLVKRGPISSMTWQANFLGTVPDIGNGFWLMRTITNHTCDGANSQLMQVWDSAGNPVLAGQQSIALYC